MKKGILFGLLIFILTAGVNTFADLSDRPEYPEFPGSHSGLRLGLVLSATNPQMRDELHIDSGLVVNRVLPGSAADKAGIREGDILLRINGKEIQNVRDVRSILQEQEGSNPVDIDLIRDGKDMSVHVTPEKEEHDLFRGPERPYIGVELQELNKDLGSYFNVGPGGGALIVRVEPESPAGKAGLQAGDVITNLDGKKIESPEDVIDRIQDMDENKSAEITVLRHGKQMTLNVTPEMRRNRGFLPEQWNMEGIFGPSEREELHKDIEKEMSDLKRQLQDLKQLKIEELQKQMNELRKELDQMKHDQTH